MSQWTVTDLQDTERFQKTLELEHQELITFVLEYYVRHKTWITYTHYALHLLLFGAWIAFGIERKMPPSEWLAQCGYIVLLFFPILLIHEVIHALVYRYYGAKDVRITGALRSGMAYATAPGFVADGREFFWLAIMPFLLINSLLVVFAVALEPARFVLTGLLLAHTHGTSGDFAMLNYLWLHRNQEVYTYDDAAEAKSYFYVRVED